MHVSIAGALAVLARLGRCLFDRLAETKSERLLKPRRTEIRFCRGTKLVRLSRIPQPKTGEYLDLAETTAQAPNREASSRRAQIGIEVGKAHKPHTLGRKARNPARGQCPGRPDLRPHACFSRI